jgi:flagellum-specific ATP synthase
MSVVCSKEHLNKVKELRALMAAHSSGSDLVRIGAYQSGTDPMLDKALAVVPQINAFLQQGRNDRAPIDATVERLLALPVAQ